MTEELATKRYDFALKWRATLSDTDVQKILFSDEMICHYSGNNPRHWVFRKPGEQWRADCVDGTTRRSGASVMAWAAIYGRSSTEICFMERDPNARRNGYSAESYKAMIEEQLPQIYEPGFLFQQDNAPIHTAHIVTEWLTNNGVAYIDDWPPYSPDLNPIENVWAELRDLLLNYTNDLGDLVGEGETQEEHVQWALDQAWNDLEESYIEACTTSFLRRLDAVIDAKGWYTKY